MTKDATGFQTTVDVPWGTKVEYKFIVDGQWKTSEGAPIERDPCVLVHHITLQLTFLSRSGRYVNNVYTAPPKPVSKSSVRPKVDVCISLSYQFLIFQPPPPPAEVAPTTTFPIEPIKDASADLPSTSGTNPPVSSSTEEASTHKPVIVSRIQSSEVLKDTTLSAPASVVPGSNTKTAAEPEPAIPKAEATAPPVEAATTTVDHVPNEPPAAAPTEDSPTLNGVNGKHSPQVSLSAARASLPTASEDGTVSKGAFRSFSGTSSIKKKRGSLFGGSRASTSDDGTESSLSGGVRKKKRSIFGKIKHMFDHHDDKDKEKIHSK